MLHSDSINIELNRGDYGSLCICAIRYCLGRKTYMPSNIQRIVCENIKYLSVKDLKVIQADIQKHGGPTQDMGAYGNYDDYKDWCNFLDAIETEIEERGKHNDR